MNSRTLNSKRRQRFTTELTNGFGSFNGAFTPEICRAIKAKRQALGASIPQLAEVIRVNLSTLRKWEQGDVSYCHVRYIVKIADFLNGRYDRYLHTLNEEANSILKMWVALPDSMHRCMERAATLVPLCAAHPDLLEGMLESFDGAMNGTIRTLLDRAWPLDNGINEQDTPQ